MTTLSPKDVVDLRAKRDAAAACGDDQIHRAKEAILRSRPEIPQSVGDFEQFLNEPPQYEDRKFVRDYRHEAYQKWKIVFKDILALASQSLERDAEIARLKTEAQALRIAQGIIWRLAIEECAKVAAGDTWCQHARSMPVSASIAVAIRALAQQPPDKEG